MEAFNSSAKNLTADKAVKPKADDKHKVAALARLLPFHGQMIDELAELALLSPSIGRTHL